MSIICWQMIHMKCQALFSLKNNNNKKIKTPSAEVMISTFRVKFYIDNDPYL